MDKRCTKCKKLKSLSGFGKRKSGRNGLQAKCLECLATYRRDWWRRDPERTRILHREALEKRKSERRTALREIKDIPCKDCNTPYPYYVMQFDHREPSTKLFDIGTEFASYSWDVVLKEIEKCDVVCANCHSIRSHLQRQVR